MANDASETCLALRSIPSKWYSTTSSGTDPARETYDEAVKLYRDTLTEAECKQIWLDEKSDIRAVQAAVNDAKQEWEARTNSKARKWLRRCSERIMHYGKVMDTIANYNPEYCALAWGSMKFLLMAVLNHEEYVTQYSKSLSQIASALPRVNIQVLIFPTNQIKEIVCRLYAYILKFMFRAIKWYKESPFKHFINAVFQPATLRFKDFLEEIESCSQTVDQLAVVAAQAEQRDMHVLLQQMMKMIEDQAVNTRLFLDSRHRTCEIQFSQILTFTATTTLPSPEDSFRYCNFMSTRRLRKSTTDPGPSWRSQKLRDWAASAESSLILVKGSFLRRLETKDFAAEVVSLVRGMKIPIIWTLIGKENEDHTPRSPVEVLKQLVWQVLQINHSLLEQQSAALNAARFQCVTTEADWFDLLTLVLEGLSQVFVVIDAAVMSREFSSDLSWSKAFLLLCEKLKLSSPQTIVKIVLVSCGDNPYLELPSALSNDITIKLGQQREPPLAVRKKARYRAIVRRGGSKSLRPFLMHGQRI